MDDYSNFLKLVNNCDLADPLLSQTELGEQLDKILLHHISPSEITAWTQALNLEQLIPKDDGLARDYRGLAQLMSFNLAEIEGFKRSQNPSKKLIDTFITRNPNKTVNDLLKLIEDIERFDVIDDFLPRLVHLTTIKTRQQNNMLMLLDNNNRTPNQQVALTHNDTQQNGNSCNGNNGAIDSLSRLTIDDTQSNKIIYDAFVCFAPEDYQYAQDLIVFFEEHGKRVATADDLLPGQFEFDALAQLIDLRCRKVIIILTPNFSRSKECEFQTKYASEIAIKAGYPKIIPVLYEACDQASLPPMIGVMSKIDMTSRNKTPNLTWPLNKLLRSLDFDTNSSSQRNDRFLRGFENIKPQQYSQATSMQPMQPMQPPAAILVQQEGAQVYEVNGNSSSPSPAIQTEQTADRDPIVELSYSQSLASIGSTNPLIRSTSSKQRDSPSPHGTSDLKSFIKHIGQRFQRTRNDRSVRSTTSQAPLLDLSKSDYIDENLGRPSGSNI